MTLNPAFPAVAGPVRIDRRWSMQVASAMNRRTDEGSLVLWRPGLTFWVDVWRLPPAESAASRFEILLSDIDERAFGAHEAEGALRKFRYRLDEHRSDGLVHALYGFAVSEGSHVSFAGYADRPEEIAEAAYAFDGLTERRDPREGLSELL